MLNINVEDIMSEVVIKVKEDLSVGKAAHMLLRHRINGILVVEKGDDNKLVGIFTTGDLLKLVDVILAEGSGRITALDKLSGMPIGKITTKDIITLKKGAKVSKALAIMTNKNVHTIPIYDGDKLIGIIGRHDILNAAFYDGI